jgi:nucleotide-binding universal stress UspA family protein
MFNNVLVGVDGRPGGRDAMALAKQLGATGATITLAHIYGGNFMIGRGSALEMPIERANFQDLLEREREHGMLDAELTVYGNHTAGRGLHQLAEERKADLLVVGSTRHALLGRVLMGDDSRAALNGAPCAIAIAPRGYLHVAHALKRMGVGYDGSPESVNALNVARQLAAQSGAKIKAMSVVSLDDVQEEKPIPADWPQESARLVDECSERLHQLDDVEGVAVYGGPREELARFGKELDLLIVGSRGYGPRDHVFHGSVSNYLLSHADCPLLVLPRSLLESGAQDQREDRSDTAAAPGR